MRPDELAEIFTSAVRKGVMKTLLDNGLISDLLTPAAAYRKYGRSNVERWLQEGLIHYEPAKNGSSPRNFLDNHRLEAIAASSNRHTYLQAAER